MIEDAGREHARALLDLGRPQRALEHLARAIPFFLGQALTLGPPATFGAFAPGVDHTYTTSTTADVVSTAGDAALSVSHPGHLANGAFTLPQPLQVDIAPASWPGPVSHATSTLTFAQKIGANDALRTRTYSRSLTFTLSTTNP